MAHSPYTLNPCSDKPSVRDFAKRAFTEDLERMELTPGSFYNFHPGSHVGQGTEAGIEMIAELLNAVLTPDMHTTVLLETMAGKGSEIGGKFEELREIIDRVELKDKLGVCLDTCHIWDGGYDIVSDPDAVFAEFDRVIGLDRLKAVHLNNSLNGLGSHKDRHAKILEGVLPPGGAGAHRLATKPLPDGRSFSKRRMTMPGTPRRSRGCGNSGRRAMSNIKVVLWDVDGTLLDFLAAEREANKDLLFSLRSRRVHR